MGRLGEALTVLDPPVRSLYVYASNPAAVAPDRNAVLRGLGREDLFTVVHERFMTDTARWADVVLPATTSLEHPDLYRSYGHYCIQRAEAAIPPVGESKSNWEVFQLLARAMGFEEPVFRRSAAEMVDELLAVPSPWREGIDRAALDQGRAVELRVPGGAFRTPSGKIEILNPRLSRPLPQWIPTHEESGHHPFRLMTGASLYSLNSTFGEREDLRRRDRLGHAESVKLTDRRRSTDHRHGRLLDDVEQFPNGPEQPHDQRNRAPCRRKLRGLGHRER